MAGRYPTAADFTALADAVQALGTGRLFTVDELRTAVPAISAGKIRVMLAALKHAGLSADLRQRFEFQPADSTLAVMDSTQTFVDESDTFLEIGLAGDLPAQGLRLSATFVDVGPEFYSSAAQSSTGKTT